MEALGLSRVAAPSLITCGLGASRVSRRNAVCPPSPQFCYAQMSSRRLSAAEDQIAVEGSFRNTVRDLITRESGKVVFASLLLELANVQRVLAASYDELVGTVNEAASSTGESVNFELPELDTSGLSDFISSNPLAILGGGVAVALPLVVTSILKKPESYGTISAKAAYEKLADQETVSQILDIRVSDDIKTEGTPDLKKYKKRVLQLPYTGEPAEYLTKVLRKFKDADNTTIYILDRFDGNSSTVAKLLVKGGFKAAYSIKDGAEGPSGWQSSGLPWLVPSKGFSLDLGNFKDLLSGQDSGSIVPTTLGVAAAAGVGLVVFSEAETALQLLGSAALVQLFVKKFLFAKDRKKTLEELQTFLDTKVAPKEFVEELKGIADVLLPKFEEVQPVSVNGAAILESTVEAVPNSVFEAVEAVETETSPASGIPAAVDAPPPVTEALEVNPPAPAAQETEKKAEEKPVSTSGSAISGNSTDLPRTSRPLSPFPQYFGLKPPTSPTPSRP